MDDALAVAEEKGWSFLRVVIPYPSLEVQMPDGESRRIPEGFVILRNAIATERKLAVEDGVIDALGA
jgi:hypothetical protein